MITEEYFYKTDSGNRMVQLSEDFSQEFHFDNGEKFYAAAVSSDRIVLRRQPHKYAEQLHAKEDFADEAEVDIDCVYTVEIRPVGNIRWMFIPKALCSVFGDYQTLLMWDEGGKFYLGSAGLKYDEKLDEDGDFIFDHMSEKQIAEMNVEDDEYWPCDESEDNSAERMEACRNLYRYHHIYLKAVAEVFSDLDPSIKADDLLLK